jgi:hypothetical protein
MTAGGVLGEIVALLDQSGIRHMVAGSFASSYHGAPRTTQDIDIVVDPTPASLDALLEALDRDRFYVGDMSAKAALAERGQFNVIDLRSTWKIDLIVRKEHPFSISEFDRRMPADLLGVSTSVASPEDTILSKLLWASIGGSDRQVADAATVLSTLENQLDRVYLKRWAEELGVADLLAKADGGGVR